MIRPMIVTAVFGTLASGAVARPSIELLPPGFGVTSLSYDGSVAAGNASGDGTYETFRWTAASGIQRLGRATVPVLGTGAGTPDISYDGRRISATILSNDINATQGVWDIVTGWQETMPPSPPGGAVQGNSYGSAWGLSGDGLMVTGFYWSTTYRAKPSTWTQAAGIVALPQTVPSRSGRVNAASYDGSVVVGWTEASNGTWQPRAWRNGVSFEIDNSDAFTAAENVNGDGTIVVGQSYNAATAQREAAIWRWNGASYDMTRLGVLPGVIPNHGQTLLGAISNNGQIAVAFGQISESSAGLGGVWTPSGGLVFAANYIAGLGLSLPPGMVIVGMSTVSPDGSTLVGLGANPNGTYQSFLVHLAPPCAADFNNDGVIDTSDLVVLLGSFGTTTVPGMHGDINGDGFVSTPDLTALLGAFGSHCP